MRVLTHFDECPFTERAIDLLKNYNIEIQNAGLEYSEEAICDELNNYDCYVLGTGGGICSRKMIELNRHLKLISFFGTGYEKYIDVNAARGFGIPVSYAPHANAEAVAEYTAALILDLVKKISYSNDLTKKKQWERVRVFDLKNKTLGIVGMGMVGNILARILCDGFGMRLVYCSRTEKPDVNQKYNTKMMSLNDLFRISNVISVNATYTIDNKGMINREQFGLMKSGTILVNTSRAELVDEEDLYEALATDKLAGVAIDGFYGEPINENTESQLLSLPDDKIIITPHNAFNSLESFLRMQMMIVESLLDVANGRVPIRNLVR